MVQITEGPCEGQNNFTHEQFGISLTTENQEKV